MNFKTKPGGPEACHMGELCNVDRDASLRPVRPGAGHPDPRGDVPMLIKVLSMHTPGMAAKARKTLTRLVGRDLGSEPGPWLEWWAAKTKG